MSKIHLVPVEAFTGLPLAEGFTPMKHPDIEDVRVFYISIDRYLEHTDAKMGEQFAYFSAQNYNLKDSFHDKSLPFGTHCIKGDYDLRLGGFLTRTIIGWEWITEGGEISLTLPT